MSWNGLQWVNHCPSFLWRERQKGWSLYCYYLALQLYVGGWLPIPVTVGRQEFSSPFSRNPLWTSQCLGYKDDTPSHSYPFKHTFRLGIYTSSPLCLGLFSAPYKRPNIYGFCCGVAPQKFNIARPQKEAGSSFQKIRFGPVRRYKSVNRRVFGGSYF